MTLCKCLKMSYIARTCNHFVRCKHLEVDVINGDLNLEYKQLFPRRKEVSLFKMYKISKYFPFTFKFYINISRIDYSFSGNIWVRTQDTANKITYYWSDLKTIILDAV
jgi:hypothetical protein